MRTKTAQLRCLIRSDSGLDQSDTFVNRHTERWLGLGCVALILVTAFAWGITRATRVKASSSALMLPWPASVPHNIYGGYSYGQGDHIGIFRYAVDWNLPSQSPVSAVLDGNAYTNYDSSGGYYVWMQHTGGLVSYYGHLDGSTIHNWVTTQGQVVIQGQQIALSDTSGSTSNPVCITGAHLHFHMLESASGPFSGTQHRPEPMTAPNGGPIPDLAHTG
jgi:murein DD-endopeptidase MepM/ murein hydrolase activator NlpD